MNDEVETNNIQEQPVQDNQSQYDENDNLVDPNQQYDDPSLGMQDQGPDLQSTVLTNDYRDVKLIELFISLSKFIDSFLCMYDKIELDTLTSTQYSRIYSIYKGIQKEKEDINFFINNEYEDNDYQKNLYSYLLFNKLFAQNLQNFRRYLNLNSITDDTKK